MKKLAFLILSLAILSFGCQPADEGGSGGGESTPAESGADDSASDDSASTETDDATKTVALKITSELR